MELVGGVGHGDSTFLLKNMYNKQLSIHMPYFFSFSPLLGKKPIDTWVRGTHLLESLGVVYWPDAGTLLGFIREGWFIEHDTDIDVSSSSKHLAPAVKNLFLNSGFELIREVKADTGIIQLAFFDRQNENIIFDIEFYEQIGEEWLRWNEEGCLVFPDRFFRGLTPHELEGIPGTFLVPEPIEEYLTLRYGDWRTPFREKTPWQDYTKNIRKDG